MSRGMGAHMYMFMPYNQFHFQQKILPSISILYCGIFTSYLQIRSLLGILIQWPSFWRDLGAGVGQFVRECHITITRPLLVKHVNILILLIIVNIIILLLLLSIMVINLTSHFQRLLNNAGDDFGQH